MADEEKEKTAGKPKPDFVLKDGREIFFDLDQISLEEYRAFLSPTQPDVDDDALLAKVSGLKPEEIRKLKLMEWKQFLRAFSKRAQEPAEDSKN